jgi:DNA helicase-2/ATP-dependent DNA helicase PcrA
VQHTDSQLQVIGHRDGPMIVLAGAGSGKTSTICVRAAHMVRDRYCEPSQHLMLTFSRKASGEMRNRCVAVLRDLGSTAAARDINVDTYHAFGYRMIRDNPALANRREGMTLQDDADRKRMMRGICKAWNLDYKASPGRFEKWYQVYSLGKNYNLCASDTNPDIRARLLQLMQNADEKHDNDPEQVLAFAVEYERRMALQNTLDFDDLCLWHAGLVDIRSWPNPTRRASLSSR